jgi:hypothetical protein
MNIAYRHIPLAPDELVGRVDEEGSVYVIKPDQDERFTGRVELITGEIFESHLGPEKPVGRVELDTGRIFHSHLAPDEWVGKVDQDGKCYLQQPPARDEYLGKVTEMLSLAHGGAAFLLLIYPRFVEDQQRKEAQERENAEKQATEGKNAGAENLKPA